MKKYIALLRGVNVGGQKKLPMAELKKALSGHGFTGVITYIQSGNIVFDADGRSEAQASKDMRKVIQKVFGYEVQTLVLDPAFLHSALLNNPYTEKPARDQKSIYFVFLFNDPAKGSVEQLQAADYAPEEFAHQPGCIHLYAANGMGKAKMNNNFFEQKLKVSATTRNLNTVKKLLGLAGVDGEW